MQNMGFPSDLLESKFRALCASGDDFDFERLVSLVMERDIAMDRISEQIGEDPFAGLVLPPIIIESEVELADHIQLLTRQDPILLGDTIACLIRIAAQMIEPKGRFKTPDTIHFMEEWMTKIELANILDEFDTMPTRVFDVVRTALHS